MSKKCRLASGDKRVKMGAVSLQLHVQSNDPASDADWWMMIGGLEELRSQPWAKRGIT